MSEFEKLLIECRNAVERYVYFRISEKADAEDILQEVYMTAFQKFDTLTSPARFKPWLIGIAKNKCNDFYRSKCHVELLSIDDISENQFLQSRRGYIENPAVSETMESLGRTDRQILDLYYFGGMPQSDIAGYLNVPLGTVKRRLHTARQNFKNKYPYPPKGDHIMKKLPEILPVYTIERSKKEPFAVKWEELMGWFLVPKIGEKLTWGMYDIPSRRCDRIYDMRVTGKAEVHGIEGVELTARESDHSGKGEIRDRTFAAQLTDTHCRYLASMSVVNGVKKYITFLDEDEFMPNWGFGENNCGNEINIAAKGDIVRDGSDIKSSNKPFLLDIVGRYTVNINEKAYDTVCVMDIETYNGGVVSEQYLDENGRTILWRRFNRNDWAFEKYGRLWTDSLPENERITVNGKTYVHWYDCVTEYIF